MFNHMSWMICDANKSIICLFLPCTIKEKLFLGFNVFDKFLAHGTYQNNIFHLKCTHQNASFSFDKANFSQSNLHVNNLNYLSFYIFYMHLKNKPRLCY